MNDCSGERRTTSRWTCWWSGGSPTPESCKCGRTPIGPDQGLVNLAVDDLPGHRDELAGRGIVTGEIKAVNKGVQRSSVADPEGSQITLIGNFRIRY